MNEKHSSSPRPFIALTTVYIRKLCFKYFRNLKHEEKKDFLKSTIRYHNNLYSSYPNKYKRIAYGPPEHDKLK